MKNPRFWVTVVAVYIVNQFLSYVVHGVLLASTYGATASVWRPEAELMANRWIMMVTSAFFSFFFVYLFAHGREGKGLPEGLRYGLVIGLFVAIPQSYDMYAVLPIPYHLALHWFLAGVVTCILLGLVTAAVYKPRS